MCFTLWHVSVHEFVARVYEIGIPDSGATTFTSKFTSRSPLMVPLVAPIPCAVWQIEQLMPALM